MAFSFKPVDNVFYELFRDSADNLVQGAGILAEILGSDADRPEIAKRMRTGNVTINGRSHFGITSPFGGTKQSGLGYRNGEEGYGEYLEIKTIGMPA